MPAAPGQAGPAAGRGSAAGVIPLLLSHPAAFHTRPGQAAFRRLYKQATAPFAFHSLGPANRAGAAPRVAWCRPKGAVAAPHGAPRLFRPRITSLVFFFGQSIGQLATSRMVVPSRPRPCPACRCTDCLRSWHAVTPLAGRFNGAWGRRGRRWPQPCLRQSSSGSRSTEPRAQGWLLAGDCGGQATGLRSPPGEPSVSGDRPSSWSHHQGHINIGEAVLAPGLSQQCCAASSSHRPCPSPNTPPHRAPSCARSVPQFLWYRF